MSLFKLPLRIFGLKDIPAVPFDIGGSIETLLRLDIRGHETQQALQGLTNEYTLDGQTARSYSFLFGGEAAEEGPRAAREQIRRVLSGNPLKVSAAIGKKILDESEDLLDDLLDRDMPKEDLMKLFLESPDQWTISWTNFPDVYHRFLPERDAMASAVDVTQPDAASEAFWPTIAEHGLGFNLLLPKKVTQSHLPELKDALGDAIDAKVEAAVDAGLAWIIDLRIYEFLEPNEVDGFTRFTPSTLTLLLQDEATKKMTPVAVRVAGHDGTDATVFARGVGETQASDSTWVYALQAARTSITVFGIWFGHVYHWHIVTAAMQLAMFKELDSDHPIRVLLDPQSEYLISFDDVLLLTFRAIAPPTSVATGVQLLELLNEYAKGREFFDDDPIPTLEALGIDVDGSQFSDGETWDRYPVAGQLLEIWNAVEKYVSVYVDQNWASDQEVQDDRPLQKWIEEAGRKRCGNVRGLPPMDTVDELKSVLTSIIFRVTAHGSSRMFRTANPSLSFVANFPPCLQTHEIPSPGDEFRNQELMRYLPNTGSIGGMVRFLFTFAFSAPYEPFVPVEGAAADLYLGDDVSNAALLELREFMIRFIEEREPVVRQLHQWPRSIET